MCDEGTASTIAGFQISFTLSESGGTADALDLGSSAARRGGSSPPSRIAATPFTFVRLANISSAASGVASRKDCFIVLCMKTTIDVPDDLLIQAKKRAAELRQPLRKLVAEGLRLRLAQTKQSRRKPKKLRLVTVAGGLPPGLDLKDRAKMHDWLQDES